MRRTDAPVPGRWTQRRSTTHCCSASLCGATARARLLQRFPVPIFGRKKTEWESTEKRAASASLRLSGVTTRRGRPSAPRSRTSARCGQPLFLAFRGTVRRILRWRCTPRKPGSVQIAWRLPGRRKMACSPAVHPGAALLLSRRTRRCRSRHRRTCRCRPRRTCRTRRRAMAPAPPYRGIPASTTVRGWRTRWRRACSGRRRSACPWVIRRVYHEDRAAMHRCTSRPISTIPFPTESAPGPHRRRSGRRACRPIRRRTTHCDVRRRSALRRRSGRRLHSTSRRPSAASGGVRILSRPLRACRCQILL